MKIIELGRRTEWLLYLLTGLYDLPSTKRKEVVSKQKHIIQAIVPTTMLVNGPECYTFTNYPIYSFNLFLAF